jgi:soluble lytic murein transglycosylase
MPNLLRLHAVLGLAACCFFAVADAAIAPVRADAAIKESPAPKPLPAEKAYLDKLDSALAPLLSMTVSTSDVHHLRDAVEAVRVNKMDRFAEAKAGISDPVGRKLADWIRLRAGRGDPAEYQAFLRDSPSWPGRELLTQRFEETLFTQGGTAAEIKGYFAGAKPQTGVGYAALASAYLAEGNTGEARKLAAKAWREMTSPPDLENGFLDRFA